MKKARCPHCGGIGERDIALRSTLEKQLGVHLQLCKADPHHVWLTDAYNRYISPEVWEQMKEEKQRDEESRTGIVAREVQEHLQRLRELAESEPTTDEEVRSSEIQAGLVFRLLLQAVRVYLPTDLDQQVQEAIKLSTFLSRANWPE